MANHKLSPIRHWILFVCLSLATFMIVLDYSIANVAIPYIAGGLSVSNDQGIYVITSFAVGNAIGLAMTGWLTKRVGQVKLITLSIILFTLLSFFCGLSITLMMLVISRFIQGFVAGPIIPLSQSLLINYGTLESRTRDLSIWAMIVVTAPVIGPVLGGYISDWYSWSWIFYINIPVGIVCTAGIWLILRSAERGIEKAPADLVGMILLVIGVACLQILLDRGQQWDWLNSDGFRLLLIGSVIAFTFLIIREKWLEHPFLDLNLFSISTFSLSIICLMVSYAIYFGTIVLVPLWLQEYMGYTAEWAGIAVCALGIGPVFFSLTTPKIIKKFGNLGTLLIAFVIFGGASLYTAFFDTDVDLGHIAFSRFIFGFGFICYINPLIGMSVQEIPEEKLPSATGIFHFVRAMVGGIGASVFTTLWERRTIFHHERIASSLTPFNPLTPPISSPQDLELLNKALDQQAAMLAINDAFYLMSWLFLGLILLLIVWSFYSRSHKQAAATPKPPLSVE